MKRIVTAHLYTLDHHETRHDLAATSASDLAAQVQTITGSKQAASLARLSWGDHAADVQAAGVRLVAVGAVVREVWRTLPPLKGHPKAPEAEATPSEPDEPAAPADAPAV